MIEIDTEKFKRDLEQTLKEQLSQPWTASSYLIGKVMGHEIQIKVTRDQDDFMRGTKKFHCVKEEQK